MKAVIRAGGEGGDMHPGYWYGIGRRADYEPACAAARVAQQ